MSAHEYACDGHASGAVRRAAFVVKGTDVLQLCAHCVGHHRERLTRDGWDVVPITAGKPAEGVGTESTPVHYALEGKAEDA